MGGILNHVLPNVQWVSRCIHAIMFNLWQRINEKGEAAIPVNPSALSALEWCEVAELFPHLVPKPFRGYEPFESPLLIREFPL